MYIIQSRAILYVQPLYFYFFLEKVFRKNVKFYSQVCGEMNRSARKKKGEWRSKRLNKKKDHQTFPNGWKKKLAQFNSPNVTESENCVIQYGNVFRIIHPEHPQVSRELFIFINFSFILTVVEDKS